MENSSTWENHQDAEAVASLVPRLPLHPGPLQVLHTGTHERQLLLISPSPSGKSQPSQGQLWRRASQSGPLPARIVRKLPVGPGCISLPVFHRAGPGRSTAAPTHTKYSPVLNPKMSPGLVVMDRATEMSRVESAEQRTIWLVTPQILLRRMRCWRQRETEMWEPGRPRWCTSSRQHEQMRAAARPVSRLAHTWSRTSLGQDGGLLLQLPQGSGALKAARPDRVKQRHGLREGPWGLQRKHIHNSVFPGPSCTFPQGAPVYTLLLFTALPPYKSLSLN